MKICFIHLSATALFYPDESSVFGGAAVQLYNLAIKLAEICEVAFILKKPIYTQMREAFAHNGTLIHVSWSSNSLVNALLFPFVLFFILLRCNADCYIMRSAGAEVGLVGIFCKIFKRKLIYMTAHEWDCTGEYEMNSGLYGLLYGAGLHCADLVITQNKEQQKQLKTHYGISSALYSTVYPYVSVEIPNRDYILWVGRCVAWKKPELYIELADNFPDQHFVMILNKTKGQFYDLILKKIEKIPNIELISHIPFDQIDIYFRSAKIFVNTSYYEGFPNTFIQAAKNGTPILSYRVNPDSILTQYMIGKCAFGDQKNFIDHFSLLINHREFWNACSRRASQYFENYHDIDKKIDQFKNLIMNTISKN